MSIINFHFDDEGYLQPAQPIELTVDDFEKHFVKAFPNSERRKWLFENYQRYVYRFQDEVFSHFEQWIDGSFISQKENPKDIDMVTFVDYDVYNLRGYKVLKNFYKFSLEEQFLDAYIVETFPEEHPFFRETQLQKQKWLELYGTDRNKSPKGFVKIIFP